ncbi:hypothetical protein BIV60_11135 [Bacillus sp. MUM 116]|uniref:hypothetical protein n=1 Tax=Bacillus sp. MUM 116 TaxID=1678002 RepID=UPI0008F56E27|nr:hypothetical protein [Bacillus sp. MUM 116]OIK14694.1 hypothetical protein BIV60_11135 [Bacillus sp. MUM 116]
MDIIDELYHTLEFHIAPEDFINILLEIKICKEKEMAQLKEKIIKFEEKRRTYEAWYQSLSPFKKFFTGRPPSHHQAVEYLVNVKQRLSQIEEIKKKMAELERIINLVKNEEQQAIVLSHSVIEELKNYKEMGGQLQ